MKKIFCITNVLFMLAAILVLAAHPVTAQSASSDSGQAVSQSGLLPVYGVDLAISADWIDGAEFPSQSAEYPNFGVKEKLQQVWDKLKPGGFSSVRFTVEIDDPSAAAKRVANMCFWGKNAGVSLIPVLIPPKGSEEEKLSAFSKALVSTLKTEDGQHLQDYSQILAFQIDSTANIKGVSGKNMSNFASALRKAEIEELTGSGLYATPIIVDASFDFELLKKGAIAGVTLSDGEYQGAYNSLKEFLSPLATATDVDLVVVEWLPGSIGAGSVDKLPTLLDGLTTDVPGKQLLVVTGSSTAFSTPAEQANYSAVAFTNLADYRSRASSGGLFLGMLYDRGFSKAADEPTPPSEDIAEKMQSWDWPEKAKELAQSWSGEKPSADMDWWLKKVQLGTALVKLTQDSTGAEVIETQAAQESFATIASAVEESNVDMESETAAADAATGTGEYYGEAGSYSDSSYSTSYASGSPETNYRSKLREGMMGILDRVFSKIGEQIGEIGTGGGQGGYATYDPGTGWSSPESASTGYGDPYGQTSASTTPMAITLSEGDVSFNPASPQVNQQVVCRAIVHNTAQTDALGLNAALIQEGYLVSADAQVSSINVPGGGTTNVEISWKPDTPGSLPLMVAVYDGYWNQLASVPVTLSVASTSGGGTSTESTPTIEEVGSAGVAMSKADITHNPSAPRVGDQVKFNVTLRNNSSVDVPQIDLYLVDKNDQTMALGYLQNVSVAKQATKTVSLDWVPEAEKSYPLLLQAWTGYDPVASVSLDPIVVAAASGGSGSDDGSGRSGLLHGTILESAPNLRRILGGRVPLSGKMPVGLPEVRTMSLQWDPSQTEQGNAELSLLIANIYNTPISNVTATLLANGSQIASKAIGTLLPKQERTLQFQTTGLPASTKHEFSVELKSASGKLAGIMNGQYLPKPTVAISNSLLSSALPAVQAPISTASTRSLLPPTFNVGGKVMESGALISALHPTVPATISSAAGQTTAPVHSPLTPIATQVPGVRPVATPKVQSTSPQPAATAPPHSVLTPNIPGVARVSTPTAATPKAEPGHQQSATPVIPGITPITPSATTPIQRSTQTTPATSEKTSANSPAISPKDTVITAPVRVGEAGAIGRATTPNSATPPATTVPKAATTAPMVTTPVLNGALSQAVIAAKPDLSITPANIRSSSTAPKAGQAVTFTMTVANIGRADASGGKLLCILRGDGKEVARKEFTLNIKAGGNTTVQWPVTTPSASQMVLQAGLTLAADSNAGNNNASLAINIAK